MGDAESAQGGAGDCRGYTRSDDRNDQAKVYQHAKVHNDGEREFVVVSSRGQKSIL